VSPRKNDFAELPARDVALPVDVLHRKRVAEAEVGHDPRVIRRRHLVVALHTKNGHQRIAGQDAEHHEDDQRDPDHGAQGEERPPQQIFLH
jgi:hypothetical protein